MTLLKIGLVLIVIYIHSGWTQKLRAASLNLSAPYLIEYEEGEKGGFIIDLLDEMEVDYEIVSPADQKYGRKDESTGKWTGMIGMVQDGSADLVATDLTMTSTRMEVVDFTPPFLEARLTVVTKQGEIESASDVLGLVFAPFTAHLWILILLAYLLTSLVFWLISRLNARDECLWDSLWCIASSFVYVSRPSPETCSRRLIVLGWWIFAIIMFVAYAVSLQPFLTSGRMSFRYGSIEDMLNNPDFKFATFKGGATHELLKNSKDDIHREVYTRLEENGLFGNNPQQLFKLLEESEPNTLGLIMEGLTADYKLENHCNLYTTGTLATRFYGFALPKGSQNLALLSEKVLQATETGVLQSLRSKWWPSRDCRKSSIVGTSEKKTQEVDIPEVGGAFVLLLVFLVVGLVEAIWDLIKTVKKEPERGPISRAMKEALCGCLPKKKAKEVPEAEEETKLEEKQNGAEIATETA